jgi:N-acetylated-alpha-linked acidic dipeptidase
MIRYLASLAIGAVLLGNHAVAQSLDDAAAIEARFDAAIDNADQLAWLEAMAAAPNHVGSPHDKANAEANLARLKSWGWDVRIETFMVLYPTPISTTIELVAPERIVLGGQEPPLT